MDRKLGGPSELLQFVNQAICFEYKKKIGIPNLPYEFGGYHYMADTMADTWNSNHRYECQLFYHYYSLPSNAWASYRHLHQNDFRLDMVFTFQITIFLQRKTLRSDCWHRAPVLCNYRPMPGEGATSNTAQDCQTKRGGPSIKNGLTPGFLNLTKTCEILRIDWLMKKKRSQPIFLSCGDICCQLGRVHFYQYLLLASFLRLIFSLLLLHSRPLFVYNAFQNKQLASTSSLRVRRLPGLCCEFAVM